MGDHARSSIPFLRVLALGVKSRTTDGYTGIDAGGPPRRIEAHRMAMLRNACAVPLCKWICPSLPESFDSPDSSDAETAKAGLHFGAGPVQWRACLGRIARARLLRVLPSNTGSQRLASGAFAVAKDHRDRFIGDRREQNERASNSSSVFAVCLKTETNPAQKWLLASAQSPRCSRLLLLLSSGRQTPQKTDHQASGARKLVQ